MSARRAHSQRRIIGALWLAPMSRHQLATCLSLHRETVSSSLHALEVRGKVRRRRGMEKSAHFGPPPVVFDLVESRGAC